MRQINIADAARRDAEVGFDNAVKPPRVQWVLPDGSPRRGVKFLKSTADVEELSERFGDLRAVGEALLDGDPEVDMELVGKLLTRTHRLYLKQNGEIAYRVRLEKVRYNPDGTERDRQDAAKAPSNIDTDTPIAFSGRTFAKADACRRFVFSRKYQLKHTNGLTFDFLSKMAKDLADSDQMMLVGAGPKGNEPLVLTKGGEPYRAFLEGRVTDGGYALILHLSNMELKALPKEES